MTLHAVDDIDDAIDATKSFLLPFELATWLRLAFVVFFIGGGSSAVNLAQNLPNLRDLGNGGPGSGPGGFSLTAPIDSVVGLPALLQVPGDAPLDPAEAFAGVGLAVLIAVAAAVVLLALAFAVLGAIMEFAFAQSLIDREVHVRRYVARHAGNGLRLLLFRIVVGVLALLVFGGLMFAAVAVTVGIDTVTQNPAALFGSIALLAVLFLLWAVVAGTVQGFTNVFVVPLMIRGDHGVLAGWARLWRSITDAPKQYLAYLFFSVVLGIGVGILGTILNAIAFLVVGIPFAVVAGVLWFVLGSGTAGVVALGAVLVLYLLAMLVVANVIKAPLQSFLRYYAMLVLGDVDADLDPIPAVRADIRN